MASDESDDAPLSLELLSPNADVLREALAPGRYDWNDLRTFYVVGVSGSFNQAAALLGCKQQTVSAAVARLERALGATLFNRSNTGATLTTLGHNLFDRVHTIFKINNEIEDSFGDHDARDAGTVQMRSTDGLMTIVLAPALPRFYAENPDIDLIMRTSDTPLETTTEADDLVIQFDRGTSMDAVAVPLGVMHFMLFATRSFLNTYGTPRDLIDVPNFRVLTALTYTHQRANWREETKAIDEYVRSVPRYGLVTDCSMALLRAFLAGGGLAMLPTYALSENGLCGFPPEEVVLLDYGLSQSIEFWLVFHRDRRNIARVRKMIDFVRELHDRPWFRRERVDPREFCPIEVLTPKS